MASASLQKVFNYIDENKKSLIDKLAEYVSVKSVSAWPENRPQCQEMMDLAAKMIEELGGSVEKCDVGMQKLVDGTEIPLPNVLLGKLSSDPNKKTVCVYGHLDVQPAAIEDGWDSEPFVLTERDNKLYGRGSSDDKGPAMGWLHVAQAYKSLGLELPVNLWMCFEGMEESGSEGLDELIEARKDGFFSEVDFVCISDNYWLGSEKPCLTYGLRGVCYFFVEIECAAKDLHSGVYGGAVHEAMVDCVSVLSKLVDTKGKILIPGINEPVVPMTEEEKKVYKPIQFCLNEYKKDVGCETLQKETKEEVLQQRWRYPSLSIHGIEGAFSGGGCKTVIPRKVIGKFSIRIVPNHTIEQVEKDTCDHVKKVFAELNSPNKCTVRMEHGGNWWVTDFNDSQYQAGRNATKLVYGCEPDLTREGGSIPVTLTFQKTTGKSVMLLPMGAGDDGAHSQNEKINIRNYIEGHKLFAAYLDEMSRS
ncbi:cytosolic non-specific dipeptidase-like isoform X2 [Bolinopsis microptera]